MRTPTEGGERHRSDAVISDVEAAFKLLARLLIDRGVSSPEAESLFRAVCVHQVAHAQAARGKRPNVSRIALVTGLDRKEVGQILKSPPRVNPALETRCRANRVLAGWHDDRTFVRKARPLALPIKAAERNRPSFWMLANRYAPDVYPGLILRELSRIGALEKLQNGKVRALMRRYSDERRTSDSGRDRAERVLSGWWNDPDFHSPSGEPAVLPTSGSRRSFKELVKRYSNEPRITPILDELLRVKAVKQLPGGNLKAVSRTYATVRWNTGGIARLGDHLAEHCATLLHNLEHPGQPRLVRRVVNAQLDPLYRAMLVRDIQEQLDAAADSIDDALNDRRATVTPGRGGREAVRLGVAMYVFEEPVILRPTTGAQGRR
ncbi:MAG TPA: DUF6502 family protein [Solirubrobacteraceae bacterium]|nr:DUF6502 family protein [Solirubrobacteraceae bacterium]